MDSLYIDKLAPGNVINDGTHDEPSFLLDHGKSGSWQVADSSWTHSEPSFLTVFHRKKLAKLNRENYGPGPLANMQLVGQR